MRNVSKQIVRVMAVALLVSAGSLSPLFSSNSALAAEPVNDDWPTSLHDLQRTGASNDTHIGTANVPQLTKAWSYTTGGVIPSTATVTGGVAYVGSWDGYEYALNATTGSLLWKTYLGVTHYNPACTPPVIGVSSPPTVQNGVVYLGGGDSYWYALDASSGKVLWKVYIGDSSAAGGNYNWAGPLIYNGYAYIGVASLGDCPLVQGKLLKVNLSTHNIENTLNIVPDGEVGGGIWTSPALDPDTGLIYTATGTKNTPTQHDAQAFLAIDSNTMEIKDSWELPNAEAISDSDFGTTTTLFTDAQGRKLVTAINKNGYAYTFLRSNLSDGPIWSQYIAEGGFCPTCGDSSVSSAAFGGGLLYMAGGNGQINGQGYPGTIRALNTATGQYVWQHPSSGMVIGELAYANGLVYVGAGNVLEVLDAATGQTLYSYDTGAQIYGGPSIAGGYVYVGNTSGEMFAFRIGNTHVPPADPNCPSGWTCQDVGNVGGAGSETYAGGNWSIKASGGGLSGTADSLRLVTQPATSDGNIQITGQLNTQQNGNTNAQAGLILRQNNDSGAPFYSVMVKPNNSLVVQYRKAIGGNAVTIASSNTLGKLPAYLMIMKKGNLIQAATSSDGTTYTLIPGTNTTMVLPITSLSGLAVASGNNSATPTSAAFSHVDISEPSITPQPATDGSSCPIGWSCQDVGNPDLVGGQSYSSGTWTVKAAGGDIWGNADQFHFIYQNIAADGTVSAQVTATPNTDANAKAGVMIRGTNAPDAAYYAAYLLPDKSIHIQYRYGAGFSSQELTTAAGALPQYLEVARSGTSLTTYTSSDGKTWTAVAASTVKLAGLGGAALGGIAVTSHNSGAIGTATINNVTIASSAPQPPDLCPSGWTCQDVGNPTPKGDQTYANGSWTLTAGGGDIWGNYDELHFVSQNLTGDGSVSAKVSSQTNSNEWAKAGPMLRLSSDPGAPYYAAFVTPSHGVVVQWRAAQGGQTSQISTSASTPLYLKVARSGDNFTAYSSANGTTWTAIAGSGTTISSFAGTALGGLAATSHNTIDASTIVFNNVVITGNTGGGTDLPAPWQAAAIGNPSPAGSVSYNNNTFTVNGGGTDIWGNADQSEYAYQNIGTDGEFVARITAQTNTDPWAKAGVMIKASTTAGSNYAAVMLTPGNGVHFQYDFNGDIAGAAIAAGQPVWLRIDRDGSLFTAYQSADGVDWYRIGQAVIAMPAQATVGMFVNAHNGGTALGTATFDNVSFTPTGGGALPTPWQATDIGTTGLSGSSSYSNGTFFVKGAGSDIWGSTDQLQFMHQNLSGSGSIVAQLNSLTNTDPWAKAGVMIKASTTAGSNYAMLAATPGNGLHMQYDFNGDIAGGNYALPNAWLKLTRAGNIITTYSSSDGHNWTQVGSAVISLPSNALIGLFVDAHDNSSALATAEFTNVSVTTP